METTATTNSPASSTVDNDVLHLGSQTKLSPEEIAKALAHHNKHHHGDQPSQAAAKVAAGKKRK
jgi:hypothetical protein